MSVLAPYECLQDKPICNCPFIVPEGVSLAPAQDLSKLNQEKIKRSNLLIIECINILLGLIKFNSFVLAAKVTNKFYKMKQYCYKTDKMLPKGERTGTIPFGLVTKINKWSVTSYWNKVETKPKKELGAEFKNSTYIPLAKDGLSYSKTHFNSNPAIRPFLLNCENELYAIREQSSLLLAAHRNLDVLQDRIVSPKKKWETD
jgi:hypothetical protein